MRIKKLKSGYEKLSTEKSRIIAHLIGDGCVFKSNHDYNIKYEVKDKELLYSFEKDMLSVYGLKLTKGLNKSGKTDSMIPFVRLRSKLVYEDLHKYATYYSADWTIKDELIHSNMSIKREFLKAFFDDEGSVVKQGKYVQVRLYSINIDGLKKNEKIINFFGIRTRISKGYGLSRNVYAIIIKDKVKFSNIIGFNLKRKQEKLEDGLF